jgi:uncharacterized membrane protein
LGDVDTDLNPRAGASEAVALAPAPQPPRRRIIFITLLFLAYAALSQYSTSTTGPHANTLAAALSVAPVVLIAVGWLWWVGRRLWAILIAALAGMLLYRNWQLIERNFAWADLVEQCIVYGLVALAFARSLSAGRIPLQTQLARQLYGELTAAESDYLRRATAAWAIFYGLLTAAVLILFFAVSPRNWSIFVNFIAWGLMILAGFLDHALRRRLLPRHREGGILALIRRSIIG